MIQDLEGIDLYSDTRTLPTDRMREAMYRAIVGDDVARADPTANRLEEMAAERVGKEAGLFVPSGHMGNLIAALVHCVPGDEAIVEAQSHIYYYEGGSIAAIGGIMPRLVEGRNGIFDVSQVEPLLREENVHYPRTRLLCVENTHNRGGGTFFPPETLAGLRALTRDRGLALHMDGARLFNASVALGVEAREIACHVDSVTFCLSKGLSAPVGSVLTGTSRFIDEARRVRKRLGGGMRQAGVLAAAGIVALEEMVDRLADDHLNARRLAQGLTEIEGYSVDLETVQTNMVRVDVSGLGLDTHTFQNRLAEHGIKASALPPSGVRFVTHRHIEAADIEKVLEVARNIAS